MFSLSIDSRHPRRAYGSVSLKLRDDFLSITAHYATPSLRPGCRIDFSASSSLITPTSVIRMIAEQLWEIRRYARPLNPCCAEIACRHLGVEPTAIGGDSARTETNSSRGWCIELIAGTTATSRFPRLITLAKIGTVLSLVVRMRSKNSC
jgi:hypothetical protein